MDSTALALTLAAFGVLLIALSYQQHRHRRNLAALAHGIGGAVLFLCGALLFALALNFNTYDNLTPEQALAELSIEQSGPQTFQIRLMRIPAGDLQVFTLKGARWQLQAHLLEWQGWARWLGLSANVRLEKLSSNVDPPNKVNDKTSPPPSNSYRLSRNPGISLWNLQQQYPERSQHLLHTVALQTEPFQLQTGMRFHIYLSDGRLTARNINQPRVAQPTSAPTVDYRGVRRGAEDFKSPPGTNAEPNPGEVPTAANSEP